MITLAARKSIQTHWRALFSEQNGLIGQI